MAAQTTTATAWADYRGWSKANYDNPTSTKKTPQKKGVAVTAPTAAEYARHAKTKHEHAHVAVTNNAPIQKQQHRSMF